jgi:two-component system, OmpR family, response regulator
VVGSVVSVNELHGGASVTGTVWIADDDKSLGAILAAALRHHGFEVRTFTSGVELLAAVGPSSDTHGDVYLLDVMMPELDGIETCGRLRSLGIDAPVMFLSALDAPADKLRGLTGGGDDYVTKPFDIDELVARLHIAIRRAARVNADDESMSYADLTVDDAAHRVTRAGGRIELTSTEYRLLVYLLRNAGRVVSKQQILDAVWNYDFDGDASVVETYIYYLRRKVDASAPKLIQTVRGAGYSLRLPDS